MTTVNQAPSNPQQQQEQQQQEQQQFINQYNKRINKRINNEDLLLNMRRARKFGKSGWAK